jgi:cytidylate kinase
LLQILVIASRRGRDDRVAPRALALIHDAGDAVAARERSDASAERDHFA